MKRFLIFAAIGIVALVVISGLSKTSTAQQPVTGGTVEFIVNGSPADVTYGPSGSDLSGPVPMDVTAKLGDPSYYAINAQLNGGGSVSCEIKVNGTVISSGQAAGGYNIASCEISQGLSGGWENDN